MLSAALPFGLASQRKGEMLEMALISFRVRVKQGHFKSVLISYHTFYFKHWIREPQEWIVLKRVVRPNGLYSQNETYQDPFVTVSVERKMIAKTGTPDSLKMYLEFFITGGNVLPVEIKWGAISDIFEAILVFAEVSLNLTRISEN